MGKHDTDALFDVAGAFNALVNFFNANNHCKTSCGKNVILNHRNFEELIFSLQMQLQKIPELKPLVAEIENKAFYQELNFNDADNEQ